MNEAEAPIVQDIFNAYLSGANTKEICDRLNAQQGSSRKWLRREIDYILMNERYAGNAIFQKKYVLIGLMQLDTRCSDGPCQAAEDLISSFSTIEAEAKFVQIGLKLLTATVIRAEQERL